MITILISGCELHGGDVLLGLDIAGCPSAHKNRPPDGSDLSVRPLQPKPAGGLARARMHSDLINRKSTSIAPDASTIKRDRPN